MEEYDLFGIGINWYKEIIWKDWNNMKRYKNSKIKSVTRFNAGNCFN